MIAILKYTDCAQDGKNIFGILSKNNVTILKTKRKQFDIYPEIKIKIKDTSELNKLLYELNEVSIYGVSLMKIKSEEGFLKRFIKGLFEKGEIDE